MSDAMTPEELAQHLAEEEEFDRVRRMIRRDEPLSAADRTIAKELEAQWQRTVEARERRDNEAHVDVRRDVRELAERFAGNPIALELLDGHQPEPSPYGGYVCSDCSRDMDGWPCGVLRTCIKHTGTTDPWT